MSTKNWKKYLKKKKNWILNYNLFGIVEQKKLKFDIVVTFNMCVFLYWTVSKNSELQKNVNTKKF